MGGDVEAGAYNLKLKITETGKCGTIV